MPQVDPESIHENYKFTQVYGVRNPKTIFEPEDCYLRGKGTRLNIRAIGFEPVDHGLLDFMEKELIKSRLSRMYQDLLHEKSAEMRDVLQDMLEPENKEVLYALYETIGKELGKIFHQFMMSHGGDIEDGNQLLRTFMSTEESRRRAYELARAMIMCGQLPVKNSMGHLMYEGPASEPERIILNNFEPRHFMIIQGGLAVDFKVMPVHQSEMQDRHTGNFLFKFLGRHYCSKLGQEPVRDTVYFTLEMERFANDLSRLSAKRILRQVYKAHGEEKAWDNDKMLKVLVSLEVPDLMAKSILEINKRYFKVWKYEAKKKQA